MVVGHKRATFFNTIANIVLFILLFEVFKIKKSILTVAFSGFALTLYYIFNIYSMEKGKYSSGDFLRSLVLNSILGFFLYVADKGEFTNIFIFMLICQNITKLFFYRLLVKDRNVIIIGRNNDSELIKNLLNEKNRYKVSMQLAFTELDNLKELVSKNDVDKIIITEELIKESSIKKVLDMKLQGIKVFDYLTFFEKLEEKIIVNRIDEDWLLYGNGFNILHDNFQKRLKRVFDFALAICIGLVTSPLMLLAAIIVKLESSGPVVFKQKRIGLGNKEYTILKFRSMRNDAEKDGAKWATKNDPRITKFGNFMRKTRIDELPQLWNVLKGEMTFVGPRPERQVFIQTLEKEIPFYNIRHSVKPGLTGWAQVKYPYGASIEDALRKLEYDLYYIKHQSFILDMMIMFKTAKTVVFGKGR